MLGRVALLCSLVLLVPSMAGAQAVGLPVTLAWDASPDPAVTGYRVYAGAQSGVYTEYYDVGLTSTFTYSNGIGGHYYYFAVSALAAGLVESAKSNQILVLIPASPTPPPPPPPGGGGSTPGGTPPPIPTTAGVYLYPAVVNGTTVSLSWLPTGGLAPIEYVLEAGSAPGLKNLYNGSVGLVTTLSATAAPGTYYVRVRGKVSRYSTRVSNEITVAIGDAGGVCTTPPPTPTNVAGSVLGGQASLSWAGVLGATSYIVQAGSQPGGTDIYNRSVGKNTAVSAAVPVGFTAYVRVIAVNACGSSAPSAEIFLR